MTGGGVWYRTGRRNGRVIYEQTGEQPSDNDVMVGTMDTRALALLVVGSLNRILIESGATAPRPAAANVRTMGEARLGARAATGDAADSGRLAEQRGS